MDVTNAIKYLRPRLKQDLLREVSSIPNGTYSGLQPQFDTMHSSRLGCICKFEYLQQHSNCNGHKIRKISTGARKHRILKLQQYIRGWVNYFKLADMKMLLQDTDEWLRYRIRAIYWKQWKRVRTRIRKLRGLNLPEWVVFELANCRKGTWRSALVLNRALTNKEIANLGYMSLTGYYLQVYEN